MSKQVLDKELTHCKECIEYGDRLTVALVGRHNPDSEFYGLQWSQPHIEYRFGLVTADPDIHSMGDLVEAGCEPYHCREIRKHTAMLLPLEIEAEWEAIASKYEHFFVRGSLEIIFPYCDVPYGEF